MMNAITDPSTPGLPWSGSGRHPQPGDLQTLPGHDAPSLPFPRPEPGDLAPLDIIGPDNRVHIPDTKQSPWRMVCHLVVENDRGHHVTGTGWFGGPSTVFTAGHNLLDQTQGHRARRVWVIPGRQGQHAELGQFEATGFDTHATWQSQQPPGFDVGVVWLGSDVGNKLGWFGFKALTDQELKGLLIHSAGYPDDRKFGTPLGTPMFCQCPIDRVNGRMLAYALDTRPGQSGSPVYILDALQRATALAVHAYGNPQVNHAVRLVDDLVQQFTAWWR